jgi:glycosyltransferase involved in cell wall biosynthesis
MRLLLATDQPFWHCRGGAHQRISQLWAALPRLATNSQAPTESLIYYLGKPDEIDSMTTGNVGPIVNVRRETNHSSWKLRDWLASWQRSAKIRVTPVRDQVSVPAAVETGGLCLNDYRWTWVANHWNSVLRSFRPEVVVLEYVTMTYLIELADQIHRDRIVWAVDTHDCLSLRASQFQAAGQTHWLRIQEPEEIAALEGADLVMAIQSSEQEWFAKRLKKPRVITVGHAPTDGPAFPKSGDPAIDPEANVYQAALGSPAQPTRLRLGFLASNNFPNQHGILNWLNDVAPEALDGNVELVVAGSICPFVQNLLSSNTASTELLPFVRYLGEVPKVEDFYREIDVVICPIALGTGLKIKLVEGLAYGCPVIASPQSAVAVPSENHGVAYCSTIAEWIAETRRLCHEPGYLGTRRGQAQIFAEKSLQPSVVYQDLVSELRALIQDKRQA